jgi:hypothetical protein
MTAMSRKLVIAGALLISSGLALWTFQGREESSVPEPRVAAAGVGPTALAPAPILPAPALHATTQPAREIDPRLDEPALMARLRALGESAPLDSIALARQGNERFPESTDAPERAGRVAKSLVNLGRFHEARDEAQAMLDRYPGTPWTLDVERHLLVYPLDQPPREAQ